MRRLRLDLTVFAAAFVAAFSRIADLDFWWHLKTGEVIAATRSIPRVDLFSFTAAGAEYIDHEWLFQLLQWWTWSALGALGIQILKCLVIGFTFALVARHCVREGMSELAALGLVMMGMAGAVTRLIERPEIFSALFAVLTVICLKRRVLWPLPLICALWANVHAAVIVGLVIQMLFILATAYEKRGGITTYGAALGASVIASGLNPFGYRVLSVPFELTRIIHSGIVENDEWRMPTFRMAPVFWVVLFAVAILLLMRVRATPVFHLLLFAFLAYLSARYVRNVGLFCTLFPMLLGNENSTKGSDPFVEFRDGLKPVATFAIGLVTLVFVAVFYFPFQRGVGEASYFPDRLAQFVESNNLRGNMLNSYGFGGYLIWKLAPERRVFIDGRNEVYVPLLTRMQTAQMDSRAWFALLRDYRIEYAVLEYADKLDEVRIAGTNQAFPASVTSVRFPLSQWALVFFDDDGMIFVRRNGANRIAGEYRFVFPEGRGYQRMLIEAGRVRKEDFLAEIEGKLREDPGSRRARALLDQNR